MLTCIVFHYLCRTFWRLITSNSLKSVLSKSPPLIQWFRDTLSNSFCFILMHAFCNWYQLCKSEHICKSNSYIQTCSHFKRFEWMIALTWIHYSHRVSPFLVFTKIVSQGKYQGNKKLFIKLYAGLFVQWCVYK